MRPSIRGFRIAGGTAALAGTALVLATAGCGPSRTLAPGQLQGPAVTAACDRPGPPLGAKQLRAAYQAPPLSAGTATGAGAVIAVIIPAPAPHLAGDLAAYSRRYGLPAPRVRELLFGPLPAPPPAGSADAREDAAWQEEGTADLEMAHALAPRAALAWLAVSPVGPPGMPGPGYDPALAWLVTRFRVTVVSYSSGIPEAWYRPQRYRPITASRTGLKAAARVGTTIVAAAGDYGPAEPGRDGTLTPGVAWPASDPLVTAVGGTRLIPSRDGYASAAFTYARSHAGPWAGGSGPSAIFARPPWQDPAAGPHRTIADIAMDASPCSPAAIYATTTPGARSGWTTFAGTSIAAPLFAGLVADAAQAAGHPLGVLDPALYQMHGPADGLTDITAGTTTLPGHPGYPARPGYDLPTGIGTITSAARFIAALARLAAPEARSFS